MIENKFRVWCKNKNEWEKDTVCITGTGQLFHIHNGNIVPLKWMVCEGNPACMKYAMRSAFSGLPTDNNVIYGKVGPFGHLVHESEIGEIVQ